MGLRVPRPPLGPDATPEEREEDIRNIEREIVRTQMMTGAVIIAGVIMMIFLFGSIAINTLFYGQ